MSHLQAAWTMAGVLVLAGCATLAMLKSLL
jgi:hypothetical protein